MSETRGSPSTYAGEPICRTCGDPSTVNVSVRITRTELVTRPDLR